MRKRRSNREIIESESPEVERAYTRTPRGELIPATKKSGRNWVEFDEEIINKFYPDRKEKGYTLVHTHPHSFKRSNGPGLPTEGDLKYFLTKGSKDKSGNLKGSFIVQRDNKTGEVEGVTYVIHNPHKELTPKREAELLGDNPNPFIKRMLDDARRLNFDIRVHPARGYYFNKERGAYESTGGYSLNEKTEAYEKRGHSLEGAVASILIGFTILFLLIKVPFTGFAISDSISNNLGSGLFLLSGTLFAVVIYFTLRRLGRKSLK